MPAVVSTSVTQSQIARVLGIETQFVNLRAGRIQNLPQRVMMVGQGNEAKTYATTKVQITSAAQAAELYGFG